MTWAEFCIKSYAWNRMKEDRWREIRELSFWGGLGYHKYKKPVQMYRIGNETSGKGATEEQREAFRKEYKEYLDRKRKRNGIRSKANSKHKRLSE